MEASSYTALYRGLGKPVREQYFMTYRRILWDCGCIATGLTSQKLLLKRCLRHHRSSAKEGLWLRR
jgi:hypothetical protein